jgi:L-ascorbate metabolism protein UlaG (beta-lactamase superfamily)
MLKDIRPDVALLQLSRQDPKEMAAFASDIGVKTLIPHHMDLKMKPEEYEPRVSLLREAFLRLSPNAKFISPQHGQWYGF